MSEGGSGSLRVPSEVLAGSRPATERDVQLLRMLLREPGRQVESVVCGVSMGSAIPVGSRVRIRHCDEQAGMAGQVVAFLQGGRIVIHRVIYTGTHGAARDYVITRGDADWLCDPPVNVSQIAGCADEYLAAAGWRAIGPPARVRPLRRIASIVGGRAVCLALEVSPALAVFLGRSMISLRTRVRALLGRQDTTTPGNVRN